MMPVDSNRKINKKLKHFEVALGTNKSENKFYVEWVVQKLGRINNQIAATDGLKLCHPEIIGSTALHITYSKRDLEVFRLLLSRGADYTLKNQNGMTVLHVAIKSVNKDLCARSSWVDRSEDPFISAVLSAHVQNKQCANPHDRNGLSHFHAACMTNNVEAVEFFLDSGVSIHDGVNMNSPYFPGYTPLHFAVRLSSFKVAEVLFNRGASISSRDAKEMLPLQILLKRNFDMLSYTNSDLESIQKERNSSEKIARLFLDDAASKDKMMIDESGLSCLHVASALMDSLTVQQLLEKVTDINHRVNIQLPLWAGYSALHFAIFFNINIVKLLVRRGADLQAKDTKGVTPLVLCLEKYKVEDIHNILSLKTTYKDITFSDGKTKLLDFIIAMRSCDHLKKFLRRVTKNVVINLPNNSPLWPGFTPMHVVVLFAKSISNLHKKERENAEESCLQMISDLFEKNPKMIETQDIHGHTPVHLCFGLGKIENIVDLLLELHEKLDDPHDFVDKDNLSLLHIACANNNEKLVDKFLLHSNNSNLAYAGESIKKAIVRGWTPLHIAFIQSQRYFDKQPNRNIINALLNHGADVNAKDAHEITPVDFLVPPDYCDEYRKKYSLTDHTLLMSPYLKQVVAGNSGLSYLHIACFRGQEEAVKKLVDQGVNVNGMIKYLPKLYDDFQHYRCNADSTEYVNYTPLYIALKSPHRNDIARFLIERGADIFAKNSKGIPLLCETLETHLEFEYSNLHNLKVLVRTFADNPDLQTRAVKDIGLTMLHIACRTNETYLIKSLLDNGANVNAQMSLNSTIWPGYTPLHVLIRYVDRDKDDKNFDFSLRLLLDGKADVTLQNCGQQTPVHTAYRHYIRSILSPGRNESTFERPLTLLRAQKDFSINPTSIEGITHFHIACSLSDVFTVEKFLKNGLVDVDQPIDFFHDFDNSWKNFRATGCTPLHLAVMKRSSNWGSAKDPVEPTSQLEIVDLLIKHGADVDAEDAWGNTPFHTAGYSSELRERLVRAGANVNATDATGCTALEYSIRHVTNDIKGLLRWGCCYNAFNPKMGIGYIGLTMRFVPLEKMQKLVSMAIINFPDLMVDEMDRTVIHNLVSIHQINISAGDYATMIEHITRTGFDIDAQDKLGRTALHIAVKFENLGAISGLLLAGADINIADVNGQTPFAQQFQSCTRCDKPTDAEDEQCQHYKMYKLLKIQAQKLQRCGLDVHPMNENIVETAFPNFGLLSFSDEFINELRQITNLRIRTCSFTLRNFMSELDVVADYPAMSELKRSPIDTFFLPNIGFRQFRKRYSEVGGLLKLQYRKAVKRTVLLQKAKISLDLLAGIRIPELCSCIILRFLKNSELLRMITANEDTKVIASR